MSVWDVNIILKMWIKIKETLKISISFILINTSPVYLVFSYFIFTYCQTYVNFSLRCIKRDTMHTQTCEGVLKSSLVNKK